MIEIIQSLLLIIILAYVVYVNNKGSKAYTVARSCVLLDSCALIDGRVLEIVRGGFISGDLVVPEFVLHELQILADGRDQFKRERARFGLDVVKQLQSFDDTRVIIDRNKIVEKQKTDDKLLELTKQLHAKLFTTDFNLIKLAEIEGIQVLNVNELASRIRVIALPGERITVKILQKGSNPKQGVGYLSDGTMVVVDDATRYIGKEVEVEVVKTHQTMAGKMIFAKKR